jgi:hypothetical protein
MQDAYARTAMVGKLVLGYSRGSLNAMSRFLVDINLILATQAVLDIEFVDSRFDN